VLARRFQGVVDLKTLEGHDMLYISKISTLKSSVLKTSLMHRLHLLILAIEILNNVAD